MTSTTHGCLLTFWNLLCFGPANVCNSRSIPRLPANDSRQRTTCPVGRSTCKPQRNDGRALGALPDGQPGITQIGWVPIPKTIGVMLLAWPSLATAAAVTTMAMTRVGTRRSGMLEWPVFECVTSCVSEGYATGYLLIVMAETMVCPEYEVNRDFIQNTVRNPPHKQARRGLAAFQTRE